MRSLSRLELSVFILANVILLTSCGRSARYTANEGVIDLRDYDFQYTIDLDGEWQFTWEENKGEESTDAKTFINIDVPDSWNGYTYKGQEIPSQGSGSYYLTVLLPDRPTDYSMDFPTVGTAYNLFANDSLIGGVGIYSSDPDRGEPAYQTAVYDLGRQSRQLMLRVDVSNHHHRLGGLWESISLGLHKEIIHKRENQVAMQLFIVGAIFIMGFYHLGVFSLGTRGMPALYFGLFCLLIGLRTLTTGEIYLHEIWPGLPWSILVKIEYLTFYLGIAVFFSFLQLQFPDEIKDWAAKIVMLISGLFALFVIFTQVATFSVSLNLFQPFSLLALLYLIYGLSLAFLRGEEGSAMVLVGFSAIVVAFINDILYVNNIVNTGNLISLGVLIFILMQALLISVRFSKAYATIDTQRNKLERTNAAYQSEIDIRKSAEAEVRKHKEHLEELVKERTEKLEMANQQLEVLSRVDGLTGIANRRRLDEDIDREWKRMLREHRFLSVILCDIDHFKLYNDTYGHQQGDDCLARIAGAIRKSVNRPGDLAARYGGEEFCIVLPETKLEGAVKIAELIRKNVHELKIEHSSSPVAPFVTLSLGVASIVPDADGQPSVLIGAADRALYQAKGNGRNRVEQNMTE
ncbi:MAG: diguanylate cyclase [Candidatus Marinimicrobia bacterium]|nr:diguanylate cyclase [Candidatus Neomarinimicrobiota bacterium]